MKERKVIACNYLDGISSVATSAKAYVSLVWFGGNLPERVFVLARSRGGRWIEKWEDLRRLSNFRRVTVAPGNPVFGNHYLQAEATEEHLARLVEARNSLVARGERTEEHT
jgi:hypothetical protein